MAATRRSRPRLAAGRGLGPRRLERYAWSGTGAITTVGFMIVALADGSPDILVEITTSDPTAEIGKTVRDQADDDGDVVAIRGK